MGKLFTFWSLQIDIADWHRPTTQAAPKAEVAREAKRLSPNQKVSAGEMPLSEGCLLAAHEVPSSIPELPQMGKTMAVSVHFTKNLHY